MASKDYSRGFYPYQPIDLVQNTKLIEKLNQTQQASKTAPIEVLDKVDELLDFLNYYLTEIPDEA